MTSRVDAIPPARTEIVRHLGDRLLAGFGILATLLGLVTLGALLFDVFRDAGRDVPLLYRTLGNAPAMLRAWTSLAWPLRQEAASPRGLRELLIMRVAQLTAASFEWLAHWDMAVKHGITAEQLEEFARERSAEEARAESIVRSEMG